MEHTPTWLAHSVILEAAIPDFQQIARLVTPNHPAILVQTAHHVTRPVIGIRLFHIQTLAEEVVPIIIQRHVLIATQVETIPHQTAVNAMIVTIRETKIT
jgi:hypothetical protein